MERTQTATDRRLVASIANPPVLRVMAACALLLALPTAASAQDAALLSHSVEGELSQPERDTLIRAAERALGEGVASLDDTRAKLSTMAPEIVDCFTADCLTRSGEALLASVGYRVSVASNGDAAAIVVEAYDLVQGTLSKRVQAACDGCTVDEIGANLAAACKEVAATTGSEDSPRVAQVPLTQREVAPAVIPAQSVRLAVVTDPIDADIAIDGVEVAVGKFVGTLAPGSHTVRVTRDQHSASEETVELRAGDGPTYVVMHLRPLLSPTMVGRRGGWIDQVDREPLAWGMTGGGALLAIGGTVLLGIDGEPNCQGNAPNCPEVFETSIAGGILLGVGVAALTSGVVLFLWDDFAGVQPAEDLALGLGGRPDGSGTELWVRGRF